MATEFQAVTSQVLKKLEDKLTCAICLDTFKDPKLLHCLHVYCKDCLQRLVVQDQRGQLSVRCPTCRQSTYLPPGTDVSVLQPAFYINLHLEIQDDLKKMIDFEKDLQVSPKNCYVTGTGCEVAEPGERATAALYVVDGRGKACTKLVMSVNCSLELKATGEKINCLVKKGEKESQYEISYQTSNRGRHQLHIKVEGEHIKGSPFPITMKLPIHKLGTPMKTISELERPWSVAVNSKDELIVAESDGHCVSIFSPTREKIQIFGSQGSENSEFSYPRGVAVDKFDNIVVVDEGSHRIQKFASDGKFITAVGKQGGESLEFQSPFGVAIHPYNNKMYVADQGNHRIQILNHDLTFCSSFGRRGGYNGRFKCPWDLAFDRVGNVYVADRSNHRIQVFTAEGNFIRVFGELLLNWPSSITIDSDNVVYVTEYYNHRVSLFTFEGRYLSSFGTRGNGPGQFVTPTGIAVDKHGVVYVSDESRVQLL